MKTLHFIWLWLTDATFRFYSDLYSKQALLDRMKFEMEENAQRSNHVRIKL